MKGGKTEREETEEIDKYLETQTDHRILDRRQKQVLINKKNGTFPEDHYKNERKQKIDKYRKNSKSEKESVWFGFFVFMTYQPLEVI